MTSWGALDHALPPSCITETARIQLPHISHSYDTHDKVLHHVRIEGQQCSIKAAQKSLSMIRAKFRNPRQNTELYSDAPQPHKIAAGEQFPSWNTAMPCGNPEVV